jgi:hypothetical protein
VEEHNHYDDFQTEANEWSRGMVPELEPFDSTKINPLFDTKDLPEEIIETTKL